MESNFRTIAPEKHPVFELTTPNIELFVLQNGIKCWYINSPEMELVRLDFKFKAGSWFQNKSFVASFTGKMLYEGTTNYSSQEIAEKLDSKGVYFGVTPELDNVSIVFYIPQIFFEEIIPIIHEMIFDAIFPQEELDILKKKETMSLSVNLKKSSVLSRYHFRSLLFGKNHPYGLFPQINQIENITRNDLKIFHNENYLNCNYSAYITGNVDNKLLNDFDYVFGKDEITKEKTKKIRCDILTANQSEPLNIEMEDTVQSSVRMGKVLMARNHPDYYDSAILTNVFGGYFGSRLMANIREEKGYTYGIGASIVSLLHSSYLTIQTDVGKNVCQLAISEIYKEMEKLCQEKISEQELDRVKQYLSGSLLRSIDGAVNIMDKFIDFDDFGYGTEHFQYQMDSIINVSADRLLILAQKYYQKHDLIEVVVG